MCRSLIGWWKTNQLPEPPAAQARWFLPEKVQSDGSPDVKLHGHLLSRGIPGMLDHAKIGFAVGYNPVLDREPGGELEDAVSFQEGFDRRSFSVERRLERECLAAAGVYRGLACLSGTWRCRF